MAERPAGGPRAGALLMPRIRTIKPEFFQHEALYDAERETGLPLRIAFAGLWTIADKAGRFEWRPRQLKLNVLPYDDCDFSAVLSALESYGFVLRYDVDGKSFGCIPSWDKHQHKNVREPDSTIPAPDCQVQAPDEAGARTRQVPAQAAGKGREGKGREREGASDASAAPPPAGLDLVAWTRWHDYRVELRKPLKPVSIPAAQRELAAFGCDQAAVVEQSVANGWQGLFALKPKSNGSRQAQPPPKRPPPTDEEIAAARTKAAEDNRRELASKLGYSVAALPR
jgi:hypothetical protein